MRVHKETKALFPAPVWQKNVQVLVPKQSLVRTGTTASPFLLALDKKKLTNFQSMKAFSKTKKLMIE